MAAKDVRMQKALTEKTAQTTKLQLEATMQTQLLQAAEASRVALQLQLDTAHAEKLQLEKSCLRLMNAVAEKEKEIADTNAKNSAAVQFACSSSSAIPASPTKKLKTKKKKVKQASKDAGISRPTNVDLEIRARKAFPIEYGDGGPERLAREYEISLLCEQLVSERDGTTAKLGKGIEYFTTSRDGSAPTTRHLADIFSASNINGNQSENARPSTPPSEIDPDDREMMSSSGETRAAMLLRLDNEHWDKHGRPHPDSAFQTSKAPVKPKKKITSARKTKATAKKPASKTRSKIAESPPAQNNGEGSEDDIVDMTA
jgi:hypothetical protein